MKQKVFQISSKLLLTLAATGDFLVQPLTCQSAIYAYTDLNPSGFDLSLGSGTFGRHQVGSVHAAGNGSHAALWSGSVDSFVDLNPNGFYSSAAYGISGSQQVGSGFLFAGDSYPHALLWSGTAGSVVDLNPPGFISSVGNGVCGGQQIGAGSLTPTIPGNHALLWSGTADSFVDLNPSGFALSSGLATSGAQQVGFGFQSETAHLAHALLWSGTAGSAVDLHPPDCQDSAAAGTSGTRQVGYGVFVTEYGYMDHALLWAGTAGSVVDLNPKGFASSLAFGVSGNRQVGTGDGHALLWSGTASSVVDLHKFLSSDYDYSEADSIDSDGNIVGTANYVPTGESHSILWTPLPESIAICSEPGKCGSVYTFSTAPNLTYSPPSGSFFPIGTNMVICTSSNPVGTLSTSYTFTIVVKDCEPPNVSCMRVDQPPPKRGAKPLITSLRSEDGYYQLIGTDNCDSNPQLFIKDSVGGRVAGPFANGDIVKIIARHGGQHSVGGLQPRTPIVASLRLLGNGFLYGVDASHNVGASVLCSAAD